MIKPNIILKIKREDQDDIRIETKNSRRFLHFVRTFKWTNDIKTVHLKVVYLPTVFNDSEDIYSKEDLLRIFGDFTDKDLLEVTEKAVWN